MVRPLCSVLGHANPGIGQRSQWRSYRDDSGGAGRQWVLTGDLYFEMWADLISLWAAVPCSRHPEGAFSIAQCAYREEDCRWADRTVRFIEGLGRWPRLGSWGGSGYRKQCWYLGATVYCIPDAAAVAEYAAIAVDNPESPPQSTPTPSFIHDIVDKAHRWEVQATAESLLFAQGKDQGHVAVLWRSRAGWMSGGAQSQGAIENGELCQSTEADCSFLRKAWGKISQRRSTHTRWAERPSSSWP